MDEQSTLQCCPCGTNHAYLNCCGAYVENGQLPPSPECLMRSRYTAFTQENSAYIRKTMRGPALRLYDQQGSHHSPQEWLGLEVITTFTDPKHSHIGYVEFIARYRQDKTQGLIHELSEFHLIEDRWYYVDGSIRTT
jgi:SEC-C motif domain protein